MENLKMPLSELDKYELINKTKTWDDLTEALIKIGSVKSSNPKLNDNADGTARDVEKWIKRLKYFNDAATSGADFMYIDWNLLTRTYGIRQQAMFIFRHSVKRKR